MTANGLLGELKAWSGFSAPAPVSTKPMPASSAPDGGVQRELRSIIGPILDVCDRVVGENGRRSHVFDWLGPAAAGAGERLAVDAYYPAHELVVVCYDQPEPHHALWAEWIPAHGLRLFTVKLDDYQGNSGLAFSQLIGELRLVCDAPPAAPAPASLPPPPTQAFPTAFAPAPQPIPAPGHATPFVLAPPPVPAALQRYLTAPPPAPPTPPRAAPAPQAFPPASQPFVATPFPFERAAPPLEPVLESVVVEQERELRRRRVGQRQAEAAARAARFVEARAAGAGDREGARPSVASTWRTWSAKPPNRTAVAPTPAAFPPTPAPFPPTPAPFPPTPMTFPPTPVTFPGWGPLPDLEDDARPASVSPARARAEAVERALTHVRSTPGPFRHEAHARATMDGDDMALGVIVAIILMVEVLVGFGLALGGGPAVLGLGLVLDAAARALGTIVAARAGEASDSSWSWLCGLIGSPAVAAFAFKRGGPVQQSDLAYLVGPIAVVAAIVLLTGLAGLPAGI